MGTFPPIVKNYSLSYNGKTIGQVIIGKNITDEKTFDQKYHLDFIIADDLVFSILFAWAGNFFAGQAMKPIQKSFQAQRKFVSDASHGPPTPLSIFYSSVDILSREEKVN